MNVMHFQFMRHYLRGHDGRWPALVDDDDDVDDDGEANYDQHLQVASRKRCGVCYENVTMPCLRRNRPSHKYATSILMPPGGHWWRLAMDRDPDKVCRMVFDRPITQIPSMHWQTGRGCRLFRSVAVKQDWIYSRTVSQPFRNLRCSAT